MYQNEPSARRRAQRPSRRGLPPGLALFPASVLLFVVSLILLGSSLVSGGKDGRAPIAVRQSAPAQTTAPQLAASPAQDEEDWRLRLVNPWNPLPEDYTVKTITLDNGARVDERCYPDLQAMMDDCRAAGNSPMICSAYRTRWTVCWPRGIPRRRPRRRLAQWWPSPAPASTSWGWRWT